MIMESSLHLQVAQKAARAHFLGPFYRWCRTAGGFVSQRFWKLGVQFGSGRSFRAMFWRLFDFRARSAEGKRPEGRR